TCSLSSWPLWTPRKVVDRGQWYRSPHGFQAGLVQLRFTHFPVSKLKLYQIPRSCLKNEGLPMKRNKGLLLAPDDLEVGRLIAIHHASQDFHELRGTSLRITAINLPFVIARIVGHPENPPLTLNVADCAFMSVSDDYAAAQSCLAPPQP